MHEMSIAMGIVDIATREVQKAHARKVDKITLDIGTLSGVEMDALDFAWHVAVKDSVLENAEKEVNMVRGRAKCLECGEEYDIDNLFDACPRCSNYLNELIRGKELQIRSLTVSS